MNHQNFNFGNQISKNLTQPRNENENVLSKREQFAVQLRKQKTRSIINQKRKKIEDSKINFQANTFSNYENFAVQNECNQHYYENNFADFQTYYGYPIFRQDRYQQCYEIIKNVISLHPNKSYFDINQFENDKQIAGYLQILEEKKNSNIESLAIISKIRQLTKDLKPEMIISVLIDTNVLQIFENLLFSHQSDYDFSFNENENLVLKRFIRLELAWIFGNLAYGDQEAISYLIFGKYLQNSQEGQQYFAKFIQFIVNTIQESQKDLQMIDQVFFILNNIFQTSEEIMIDICQKTDFIHLITILQKNLPETSLSFYENLIYLMTTIVQAKQNYKFHEIEFLIDISVFILKKSEQNQNQENYICQITKILQSITKIIEYRECISGLQHYSQGYLLNQICSMVSHPNIDIRNDAVFCIGSLLSTENKNICDLIRNQQILKQLIQNTLCDDITMLKNNLWAISNYVASGPDFSLDFASLDASERIISLIGRKDPMINNESLYVLCNSVNIGMQKAAILILKKNQNVIAKLLHGIEKQKSSLLVEIIQCLINFLKIDENHFKQFESVASKIEKNGGNSKIQELLRHNDQKVQELASKLYEIYYNMNNQEENDLEIF